MSHLNRMGSLFCAGAAAALFSLGTGWAQSAPTGGPAHAPSDQTPSTQTPSAPATGSFPKGPGSLQGTWVNASYKWTGLPARKRVLADKSGAPAPLLPAARDLVEKRIVSADAGHPFVNTLSLCLPGGVPEMDFGAADYGVQILETPGQVAMLYDEQNHFRIIKLDQPHPKDPDPSYMGDSVGHWEGDTLVVDVIAINEKTTLDMVGTPHSDLLHVVERFRRVAPDRIEILVDLDDPKTFTKPWTALGGFKAAPADVARMDEYICVEDRSSVTAPK